MMKTFNGFAPLADASGASAKAALSKVRTTRVKVMLLAVLRPNHWRRDATT